MTTKAPSLAHTNSTTELRNMRRRRTASLILAATLSGLSLEAAARFPGRQLFYAGGANTHQPSVLSACRVEIAAYNAGTPSSNPAVSVVGARRASASGPEITSESYYCSVKFRDGSVSDYFGGVGGEYVCPPNASAVSVRDDGQFYVGGVACECNSGFDEVYGQCADPSDADSVASADKNAGGGESCSLVGNPVNPATGSKFLSETDYSTQTGSLALEFVRSYNSVAAGSALNEYLTERIVSSERASTLGRGWRHNYESHLEFDNSDIANAQLDVGSRVVVVRANGAGVTFTRQADGSYISEADVAHTLEAIGFPTPTSYRFVNADDDSLEAYDAAGKLVSVSARGGWQVSFEYSDASTPPERAPAPNLLLAAVDATGRAIAPIRHS